MVSYHKAGWYHCCRLVDGIYIIRRFISKHYRDAFLNSSKEEWSLKLPVRALKKLKGVMWRDRCKFSQAVEVVR